MLGRKAEPPLQATCCHKGDASAQRAAPGRAEILELALRRRHSRPKFWHFTICEPCKFRTHEPTLVPTNSMSNKFSQASRPFQNVKHISKNKLTGGYRKRSSGPRAIKQNVKFFPGFPVRHLDRFDAPAGKNIAWTEKQTVSTSHVLP